jgi:phosphoglycerate dehydrogenase-like enzyme
MSSRPRIVIPGDDPPQLQGSPHLERLRAVGDVVMYTDRPADDEKKVRRAAGAVCVINSRSAIKWPADVLRRLPELRMLTVCGIGTDAVDVAAAGALGITVCNVPGQTAPIVAEHALALMLTVARRVVEQTALVKAGGWRTGDNLYLRGKLLGVVGAGPIGAAMVGLGRAIGMRVQAWTFHPSAERAAALGVPFVALEELLRTSDVVSLHVPLTDRTRGLLGPAKIGLMKPGAILVNTARGAVVDAPALAAALRAGRLAGAGIDVYEEEPVPPGHPLLACDNVVLTPHVADQNAEGMDLLNAGAVDNVIAFLEGRPRNRVT